MTNKGDQPYQRPLTVDLLMDGPNSENMSQSVPLAEIEVNPDQPRRYFDQDKMQGLVESIQEHGILQPLLVQPKNSAGYYRLIAGERRYRAAEQLQLLSVPIMICEQSNEALLAIALVENLQREDLNPVEETEGILKLLAFTLKQDTEDVVSLLYRMQNESKKKVTHNVMGNSESEKVMEVFQTVGTQTWQSFVNNRLPLLKLPVDILDALRQGKIEYTKAKEITKLKDEMQRAALLQAAIAEGLSLNQIKQRLVSWKEPKELNTPQAKILHLSQQLAKEKLWDKDKSKWKKVEGWLNKIEQLLTELKETENDDLDSTDTNGEDLKSEDDSNDNHGLT
ncbi:MAG: ParB/RepB/Spo0J family partition protein [Snowella sp.]|nr:ParB/RepB/Spo0J family partition protein [Snowella sp.]